MNTTETKFQKKNLVFIPRLAAFYWRSSPLFPTEIKGKGSKIISVGPLRGSNSSEAAVTFTL
jgi:hypothetical protein